MIFTFGNETTYKLGGRWSPIRDLVVRGTYGTAYRAPNVGELYGGAADDYPAVRDPCNNPTPAIQARCASSGPGGGVPGGNSHDPSVQFLSKHIANPNLGPETAKIWTVGAVIQPQMIRALSMTVDYYNISVEKTITTRGAAFILQQCYAGGNLDMCNLVLRDSAGAIIQINDERANVGAYHTTGFDFAVRYDLPVENYGRFNFIVDGTLLRSFRFTDEIGVITNGYDDYTGAQLGALPKLKVNAGVFWSFGGFGAGLSGRYVGSYKECVDPDGTPSACNIDSSGGERRVSSYLPFDVFVSYTLRNWTAGTTALVLGVQNVANTHPPYIYSAFAANSDPSTYDYLGRFVYSRLTHNF